MHNHSLKDNFACRGAVPNPSRRAAMLGRLWLIVMLSAGLNVSAHLIYQDSFSYPDGPILGAPGSPWNIHLPPTNQINVVSGELFLTQTEQESVRYTFPSTYTNGSLTASFKVRVTALPAGEGNYFAFFRATSSTFFCRLWISTNGASVGKYRLGITSILQPVEMIPFDFAPGETHTLVMRLAVNGALFTSTLWVDPVSESDTVLRAEKAEVIGPGVMLAHFAFKQVAAFEYPLDGMGDVFVDDLRIGRTFNDVMPLRFTSVSSVGAKGVQLLGAGLAGTNYTILANTNLNTTNWFNIGSATANGNGVIDFTDTEAIHRPACFYRLQGP